MVYGEDAIQSRLQLERHQNSTAFAIKQMLIHCELCNIEVSEPEAYKNHINSMDHKKNDNLQQDSDAKGWTCQDCQVTCFGSKPLQQHLVSWGHQREVRKRELLDEQGQLFSSLSSPPPPTPKTDALKCILCSATFHSPDAFFQHIETSCQELPLKNLDAASEEKQRSNFPRRIFKILKWPFKNPLRKSTPPKNH